VTVAVVVLPPVSLVKRPAPLVQVRPHRAGHDRPPVVVERELAAVAVARFQTPDQPLSDLDRESIQAAIQTAGAEGGELLVWARAREQAHLPEAARRADAILALVARQGALATTRVTASPDAAGPVEVQVSATTSRVQLPYTTSPEADVSDQGTHAAPLEGGDASRSQLRESAQTHLAEIERCLALGSDGLESEATEVLVRVAVDPDGSAVVALRHDSPLWRKAVDVCLSAEARGWRLPLSDGGYIFDLPVHVARGGGAP
jgi:hypothetical protein